MKTTRKQFTPIERLMVVAILLFAANIAIQNLVHSMRASEENTVHAATSDFVGVRNMYAKQDR